MAETELLQTRIANLSQQLDGEMTALVMGRDGLMGNDAGVTSNIARLGIAREVLEAVLSGSSLNVALDADELNPARIVQFNPNALIAGLTGLKQPEAPNAGVYTDHRWED